MINEFITDICELLKIDVPHVSYDTSHSLQKPHGSNANPLPTRFTCPKWIK